MKNKSAPEPELSRPLRIEKISPNGVEEKIIANERERKALSERFDLIEIKRLNAELHIVPEYAGLDYAVTGNITAEVVQNCVVTLEPLTTQIAQPVDIHYASPDVVESGDAERDMEEEDMEPIENGTIDLGELVAQHLGLALDPYPRKPGLPALEKTFGENPVEANPFAKLASSKAAVARLIVDNEDKRK